MKIEKSTRLQKFLDFINKNNQVTMKTFLNFASENDILHITARRDLKELEYFHYIKIELGMISILGPKKYEITRNEKQNEASEAKQKIAKKAQDYIDENIIFVSAGTTLEYFVKNIDYDISQLYTNGFEIIKNANNNKKINRVICIGGRLRPQSSAFCGSIADRTIDDYTFKLAFISATNINADGFIYNNHPEEANIIKKIIEKTDKVICLVDSSKFDKNGLCKIEHVSKIDLLITEKSDRDLSLLKKICNVIEVD